MHPRIHLWAGLRLVLHTPSLLAWVYFTTLVVALPLTLGMKHLLQGSFEGSLVEENMSQGFDLSWYEEFASGSSGLGKTFGPRVVGILPVLGNLERLLDGKLHQVDPALVGVGILMVLAWSLLLGGILSRFAHEAEPHSRSGFLARGGLFFWRFLRLAVISWLLYWGIFRGIGQPLHGWIESATRDTTVERTVLICTVLAYALLALLFLMTQLVLDYARISLVVEERRSVLSALFRALGFVKDHWRTVLVLYLLLAAASLLWFLAYSQLAPGPGQSTWSAVLLAFLLGQAYLLGRWVLKLWFLASQTRLFVSSKPRTPPVEEWEAAPMGNPPPLETRLP
jgi:hypothetical protein